MWGFFAFFGSDKAAVNTSLENGLRNSSCWCGDCRWLLLGKRKRVSGACGVKRTGRERGDLFLVGQRTVGICCWKVRESFQPCGAAPVRGSDHSTTSPASPVLVQAGVPGGCF